MNAITRLHFLKLLLAGAAFAPGKAGLGRSLLLKRLDPSLRFRPFGMVVLQAVWLVVWAALCFCWFRSMQWAAATHIAAAGEPDLVGFSIWAIFLSLGFFTAWALVSWPVAIAPLLMLLEGCNPAQALARRFGAGRRAMPALIRVLAGT